MDHPAALVVFADASFPAEAERGGSSKTRRGGRIIRSSSTQSDRWSGRPV